MPFGRRQVALRPIKTDKHEVTWSNLAQDASTVITIVVASAVQSADKNASTEIEVGSHVKSIYFEFMFSANVVTNPKVIHWKLEYLPSGGSSAVPSSYYQPERSYTIKRGMEMLPKDLSTVYKRVFVVKIPRIYQRGKQGGQLRFRYIATSAEAINACGFLIYKEFY